MIHGRSHRAWRSPDRNRKTNRRQTCRSPVLVDQRRRSGRSGVQLFRGVQAVQMMADSSPAAANSYATLGTRVASLPPLTSMSVPVM